MNILLLEDDYDYNISISEYLQSLDYCIDSYDNGNEAYEAIYDKTYHLLILDIRVPGLSGYEIVQKLKDDNKNIPVIFITSLTDINNLAMGYELGCNDYIKKPFSVKELKYRIQQVLKNNYASHNEFEVSLIDDFIYNISNKELSKNGKNIELTKKEKEVVFALFIKKDIYISIEQLRCDVWDDKFINEADIRVCIKNIRDKTSKDLIINKRSIGYKIVRTWKKP